MPKKPVGPRISDQARAHYKQAYRSVNSGAEYVLEAWPALYRRALSELAGRFTSGELCIMIDVANGLMLTPQMAGQHLALECVDGMALDGLDEKWSVDRRVFADKLQFLTPWQATCLEVWSRAFWEGDYDVPNALENYVARLATPSQ